MASFTLSFAATLENASLAAQALAGLFEDLDAARSGLCQTAVMEALVNIVKHGYQLDPEGVVLVTAECGQSRIEICVEDRGAGMDPALFDALPAEFPDLPAEGGMGVAIIKSVMDQVLYSRLADGRNRLQMRVMIGNASGTP